MPPAAQENEVQRLLGDLQIAHASLAERERELVEARAEAEAEAERQRQGLRAAHVAMTRAQWESERLGASSVEAREASERAMHDVATLQRELAASERETKEATLRAERHRSMLAPLVEQREQETAWWQAEVKAREARLEAEWRERYVGVEAELQRKAGAVGQLTQQARLHACSCPM